MSIYDIIAAGASCIRCDPGYTVAHFRCRGCERGTIMTRNVWPQKPCAVCEANDWQYVGVSQRYHWWQRHADRWLFENSGLGPDLNDYVESEMVAGDTPPRLVIGYDPTTSTYHCPGCGGRLVPCERIEW